jgi:competence protein ComEC
MVRVTLFFMAGVLLAIYSVLPFRHLWVYVTLSACSVLFFSFRWMPVQSLRTASGTLGLMTIFLLGFVSVAERTATLQPDHLLHVVEPPDAYVARISSYPHEKAKSWRLSAVVEQVRVGQQWQPVSGIIHLYLSKQDRVTPFEYGDRLLIRGAPQPVGAPHNPGEFDYQRFLSFKNIFHQHFVLGSQVQWLSHQPASPALALAIRARAWSEQQINEFIPTERERAVANALVLGITDGLDNELTSAYASTGAMHVLAVSGLHVSIIYGLLLLLLKPMERLRYGLALQTATALFVLWMYAAITGLSPSVLRAVTMFSFVVLAKPFQQRTNIYNTLAAAAFCLLVYDPYLIMSVGFQLSFLAVLGIVYLQPLLYNWWEPQSFWVDQVWKVSCVSIAAQLATFALGLLYFHQFPNYFLISNLVVIPASYGVLVGGLLLLAVAPVNWLETATGWCLDKFIGALNQFVFWIESWPYSLSENWYITTFQCWTLIALVTCVILLFQYRSMRWLYVSVLLALVFSLGNWQRFHQEIESDRLTVYHVRHETAFDVITAGTAFQKVTDALAANPQSLRFHLKPNQLRTAVVHTRSWDELPTTASRHGVTWLVWKENVIAHLQQKQFRLPQITHIDWLIVSRQTLYDLQILPENLVVRCLIFDSSCSPSLVAKLTEQAHARGWRTHDVSQQAFQVQL